MSADLHMLERPATYPCCRMSTELIEWPPCDVLTTEFAQRWKKILSIRAVWSGPCEHTATAGLSFIRHTFTTMPKVRLNCRHKMRPTDQLVSFLVHYYIAFRLTVTSAIKQEQSYIIVSLYDKTNDSFRAVAASRAKKQLKPLWSIALLFPE